MYGMQGAYFHLVDPCLQGAFAHDCFLLVAGAFK